MDHMFSSQTRMHEADCTLPPGQSAARDALIDAQHALLDVPFLNSHKSHPYARFNPLMLNDVRAYYGCLEDHSGIGAVPM